MSTNPAPAPEPDSRPDPAPGTDLGTDAATDSGAYTEDGPAAGPTRPSPQSPRPQGRNAAAALIFDDPLSQRSADDSDRGWGERPTSSGSAADLARFLDEKPPHHL
ncbi:hypothetical protein MUU72_17710 [Streptomyces sp. RS10V-4]|uniref:hypothetical protein n=1 Tax=Streptomyces rhizoryzae TaxID=2932493 RepID=UPI002005D7E8|nr:hypothetical protein [Streptomyces rhizoryzae]MCK7624920.1 hypothetical protein [Streptomyces rhizoryzae]